jgi:type IX secretion system substrate protein
MVSIPGLNPVDQDVLTWWSGKDPAAAVFGFNGGYSAVTVASPGEGYWMKHLGANVYNTGDEWPAGGIQIVAHDPIPGIAGWNLIGGYENIATTSLITTTPPGLVDGPVFGFSGGYSVAATLEPGYGYWIKLTGAGDINIPSTLLGKGDTEPVEYFKEEWGKIIITDKAGRTYVLYAVTGEVNLDSYEMPPSPPEGSFDIRFSSNRIAEDINRTMQTIQMSGVEYPIVVKVENMDIRVQDESGRELNEIIESGQQITINSQLSKLVVTGEIVPDVYSLEQNYPNPFNPSTVIEFSLPEDVSNVRLTIYNALGERVAELVNTTLQAGKYRYQWDARNVATGMYIYELRTNNFVSVKKMMLLK